MLITIGEKKPIRHLEGSFYPHKITLEKLQQFINRKQKKKLKNADEDKLFCELNNEGE